MAITEDQRHDLYEGLIEVLGREKATTLMEHLPPVGWADVATKRDLDHQSEVSRRDLEIAMGTLGQEMTTEFAAVRNDMAGEFAAVRNEMTLGFASVRNEMAGEFAGVRSEMALGFANVRRESSGEFAKVDGGFAAARNETTVQMASLAARFDQALREQARTFFLGLLAANASLAGVVVAATQWA